MKIALIDSNTIAIGPIDLFCCELLRQIRVSAEPGDSAAARARLFPRPTRGQDAGIDRDWREYVEPELEQLFESHLDRIDKDMEGFPSGDPDIDDQVLHIPVSHLEAWIHGLNQARLAIAARYDFTEADMDGQVPVEGDERALALFQMHFYAVIQECFLRLLGSE
jgi:hypothetical protein